MKQFIFFLLLFSLSTVYGQNRTEGHILYKFESKDFGSYYAKVYFKGMESLYIKDVKEKVVEDKANSKQILTYSFIKYYMNNRSKEGIKQKQLDEGKFIRTTFKLRTVKWQIHNETKMIQGYRCKKATTTLEEWNEKVTVWYTSDIQASTGLPNLCNLPGVVLQANYDNGSSYTVQSVVLQKISSDKLEITEGKMVSNEEYNNAKTKGENWIQQMIKSMQATFGDN